MVVDSDRFKYSKCILSQRAKKMPATHESIYRELKLLKSEIKDLKNLLVTEVESEDDELNAIIEGEKEFKAGKYTDWSKLKARKNSNVKC